MTRRGSSGRPFLRMLQLTIVATVLQLWGAAGDQRKHRSHALKNITIANAAVRVSFSASTGELVSLVNLQSSDGPDEYLNAGASSIQQMPQQTPQLRPFCSNGSTASAFYIKTGGDPARRSGWKGPPLDRCCRMKDSSGANCRWYHSLAECEAALPSWSSLCLSCAAKSTPIGCPMWTDPKPPAPKAGGHGLFLVWLDAAPPPVSLNAGWAGGTPALQNCMPSLAASRCETPGGT